MLYVVCSIAVTSLTPIHGSRITVSMASSSEKTEKLRPIRISALELGRMARRRTRETVPVPSIRRLGTLGNGPGRHPRQPETDTQGHLFSSSLHRRSHIPCGFPPPRGRRIVRGTGSDGLPPPLPNLSRVLGCPFTNLSMSVFVLAKPSPTKTCLL